MTWLLWLGLILCLAAVGAAGLAAYGAHRWAGAVKALHGSLGAGRIDAPRNGQAPPTRYDARELKGLPEPVQRYFRAVLRDGQPIIDAVTIAMAGKFNLSPTGEQWRPFTSKQSVVTRRPGFL